MNMLLEMAEVDGLGKQAQKCGPGYKRVKHPTQGFVCIPKQPCTTGYRFNAKQFACVPTAKTKKQLAVGQAPGAFPGINPATGLPFLPGFSDPTQYPGAVPGFPGVDPFSGLPTAGSYPGAPYPGTQYPSLPGSACAAGLVQDPLTGQCIQGAGPSALYPFGTPQAGQCAPGTILNPQTGQCVNPLTGQPVGFPLQNQPLPFGGQPPGPSALYPFQQPAAASPFGGYGGFAPTPQSPFAPTSQYGGYGPPGPSFDVTPDTGGGGDFIPDDVQMNLTPPGTPQSYGPQLFSPQIVQEQSADEYVDSGGTDEAAYGGMMGLGVDAQPDYAKELQKYRDIGLDTAGKIIALTQKPGKPAKPTLLVDEGAPSWQAPVMLGIGALLVYGLYKAVKKAG